MIWLAYHFCLNRIGTPFRDKVGLAFKYSGVTKAPWGGERGGFVVTGKIKRSE